MEQPQYPEAEKQVGDPQHQHQGEESLTTVAETCELPKKQWQCDRCGKIFKSASAIKGHIEVMHNDVKYKCEICAATMKWKYNLKTHMRNKHNIGDPPLKKTKTRKCQRCNIVFTSNYLLNHHIRTVHKENPFKCDICGETFNRGTTLSIHKLQHQELVMYTCRVCGMRYRSKYSFQMHVQRAGHRQTMTPENEVAESKRNAQDLEKVRHISEQNEVTESNKKKQGFEKAGHQHIISEQTEFAESKKQDQDLEKAEHQHIISEANEVAESKESDQGLEKTRHRHNQITSEENEVTQSKTHDQCLVCPKSNKHFAFYQTFRLHVNKANGCKNTGGKRVCETSKISHPNPSKISCPDDTKYKCKCCAEIFASMHGLKDHMQSIHAVKVLVKTTGKYISKYPCPVCKKLVTHSGLTYHEKKHAGVKNYSCDQCDYKCILETDLAKHQVKHTGERLFKCRFCSRQFSGKSFLVDHENKLHLHIGVQPYQCNVCQRKFDDNHYRLQHQRKCKKGVKYEKTKISKSLGFRCMLCSAVFGTQSALTYHKKTKHVPDEKTSDKLNSKQSPVVNDTDGKVTQPGYHPSCPFCSEFFSYLEPLVMHEDKCFQRKDASKKASWSKVLDEDCGSNNNDGLGQRDKEKVEVTLSKLNSKHSLVVNDTDGDAIIKSEYHPLCPFCWEMFSSLGALVVHENECFERTGARERALWSNGSVEASSRDNTSSNNGLGQTKAQVTLSKFQCDQKCKGLKQEYPTTDQAEPNMSCTNYCSTCGKSTAEMINQLCPSHQVTCSFCKTSFKSDQDLEAHLTKEYLDMLDECMKLNSSSNICSTCGKTTQELVQEHAANHFSSND